MDKNTTVINAKTGIAAGMGAGFIADKLIKANPNKPWTNFISNKQTAFALRQTSKDVFQSNKENIIEKADGALRNADNIAKATKTGLENLAKRFNLGFDENSTAKTILSELETKTDKAIGVFANKCKNIRKGNFIIAGAAAGAAIFGTIGTLISKSGNKAKKEN